VVLAISVIFFIESPFDGSSEEALFIINDLSKLKDACLLHHKDTGEWLKPGEEEKLDRYYNLPVVNTSPRLYAKVMIGEEYSNSNGAKRQNIGVELMPGRYEEEVFLNIEKKLIAKAKKSGLLRSENDSESIYRSGANVYINVR
jgi:hypothetical protein